MNRLTLLTAAFAALTLPAIAQEAGQVSMTDRAGWFENPSRLTQSGGQQVYDAICAACHMPDGEGATGAGAYPALAGSETLLTPDYAIYVILQGHKAMPPLGGVLDDTQVADVVNYIRTSFGNDYAEDPATPDRVADAR
ncbi:MAG: c-type cytochrome [Paracoccus sp. (in: a-proteobacteria)]|uniref:c-type cytochrome n=1 Tax=Paracoccus sp. TaxID=267 RepID=UPI00391B99BA